MAERRRLELCPEAGAVRRDHDDAARRRENAPNLPQQCAQHFRILDSMRQDDPVDTGVRQRKIVFFDQRR
jgi:hypothetical protein